MITRAATHRLAAALLAGSLLLTGCAGGSSVDSATAEGAAAIECDGISTGLQQIGDDLAALPDKVPDDLAGVEAALDSAITRAGDLGQSVTDADLEAKVTGLTESLNDLKQEAQNAANDPVGSAGDLLKAVSNTRTGYDDLKAYCGIS